MKKSLILLLAMVLVFSLFTGCQSAEPGDEPGDGEAAPETLKIGHITPLTGMFGHVGPMFNGAVDFTLGLVNEAPPLGREVMVIHQDFGTIGEGQAVRKLVDSEKVDVQLNVAQEYMSYRDWLLGVVAERGGPLLPSVHGGAIDVAYGGNAAEPIFRGAPMDTDQGAATAIQAQLKGAKTVVVMAVENEGMQMQQDAAVKASKILGMEVLGEIDFQPEATSYRSEVTKAQALNPDALLIFSAAEDGGTMVRNAAEIGMSTIIVGATDWMFVEFPKTATMDALNKHKYVGAVGFTHQEGPAWDFYKAAWEASEYAELSDAGNSYVLQYYDLLNVSMLAIEKAGGTDVAAWVDAMYDVSMAPGKKVYTYAEGIEALRNGEDIDYDGVTGAFNYTETGVVGGIFGIFEWLNTETLDITSLIEGQTILDVTSKF